MKYFLYLKICAIVTLMTLVSCSNDINPIPADESLDDNLKSGTWRITYFLNGGIDETSYFSGYIFTFQNSGEVVAVKSSTNVTGSWNTKTDNSQLILNLNFFAQQLLENITEDWIVIDHSANKVRLKNSISSQTTNYLTFEKN